MRHDNDSIWEDFIFPGIITIWIVLAICILCIKLLAMFFIGWGTLGSM